MWKTTAHTFRQSKEDIPLVRKYIGYILLIAFINTIVFPTHSIVHRYVKPASLWCTVQSNANLVEYLVEDYLDVTHPPMDASETDVHDMEISLEDIDFIQHTDILYLHAPIQAKPVYHQSQDFHLIHLFLAQTTPPPEA